MIIIRRQGRLRRLWRLLAVLLAHALAVMQLPLLLGLIPMELLHLFLLQIRQALVLVPVGFLRPGEGENHRAPATVRRGLLLVPLRLAHDSLLPRALMLPLELMVPMGCTHLLPLRGFTPLEILPHRTSTPPSPVTQTDTRFSLLLHRRHQGGRGDGWTGCPAL